jgi:DNA-binding NtrC family response regulator
LPLARFCLGKASGESKQLTAEVCEQFERYPWPGNIPELLNVVSRAAILAPGNQIMPEHLPAALHANQESERDAASLADMEYDAILAAIERNGGHLTLAAREMELSRRKLLYRLKEYDERSGQEPAKR